MSGPCVPSAGWAVNANAEPSGAYAAVVSMISRSLAIATVSVAWLGVWVGSLDGGAGESLAGGEAVLTGSPDGGTGVSSGSALGGAGDRVESGVSVGSGSSETMTAYSCVPFSPSP